MRKKIVFNLVLVFITILLSSSKTFGQADTLLKSQIWEYSTKEYGCQLTAYFPDSVIRLHYVGGKKRYDGSCIIEGQLKKVNDTVFTIFGLMTYSTLVKSTHKNVLYIHLDTASFSQPGFVNGSKWHKIRVYYRNPNRDPEELALYDTNGKMSPLIKFPYNKSSFNRRKKQLSVHLEMYCYRRRCSRHMSMRVPFGYEIVIKAHEKVQFDILITENELQTIGPLPNSLGHILLTKKDKTYYD